MKGIFASVVLLASSSMSSFVSAAGNAELGQQKAAACIACHGPDGNSVALPPGTDPWPKLAGQMPEYITKQLHDFKAGKRKNEQMSPQAQNVVDADIADIAAFFAKQQVSASAAADKSLLAQGEKLFLKGKGRPAVVAACVGCHGINGVGQRAWADSYKVAPPVLAPAIGGQHSSYVAKQLKAFRDGSRANDVGLIMHNIAARLDDKDIAAVAEYVAALGR
ncbi:MAG: cytochrome c4 [Betaproteobacteria bacterium]|nr:cytochrome c4 [Betaproteobacteria bacterium]